MILVDLENLVDMANLVNQVILMYLVNLVILVIFVNSVIWVILAIYCQQLENVCQLNEYIGIGYIPATIGEYTSVGGCLSSFQAQVWGMCIF